MINVDLEFVAENGDRNKIQNLQKVVNYPMHWTVHIKLLRSFKTKSYRYEIFLPDAATIPSLLRELRLSLSLNILVTRSSCS
jgi:hypothetical protein